MTDITYVVVGAGLAGARAVQSLREDGVDGRVVLIGDETHLPYERPDLSKGFLAGEKARDELTVHDEKWYAEHDVDLMLGRSVLRLDPGSRTLHLDGDDRLGFDRLLLATGSSSRPLDLEGATLPGVHYLRSVEDSQNLQQVLAGGGPLVVIGGGWIGLEVAAVARSKKLDVVLLEMAATPLARVMGEEVGQRFARLHRDHGVDVRTGVTVSRIRGQARAEGVELADGTVVPAAVVIAGVGAAPNVALAEAAGLELAGGGVAVNERLVSSHERVWAAGDIAYAQNAWFGGPLRVEHVANADDQGAFAGRSMAGHEDPWAAAPFFYSDQYDTGLEYWGWADPKQARVVVRDLGDAAWTAFWLDAGKVAAGMHVSGWDDADAVKALVTDRAEVDPERLADPQVDWSATQV